MGDMNGPPSQVGIKQEATGGALNNGSMELSMTVASIIRARDANSKFKAGEKMLFKDRFDQSGEAGSQTNYQP